MGVTFNKLNVLYHIDRLRRSSNVVQLGTYLNLRLHFLLIKILSHVLYKGFNTFMKHLKNKL
jgi:formylmethanofuran dehydrogenase subunit B